MIYRFKELIVKEGNERKARQAIKNGKYTKIFYGIYLDQDAVKKGLEEYCLRFNMVTITLQTAYEYYELTDYITDEIHLSSPQKARPIKEQNVKQHFMTDKLFFVGREKISTNNGYIFIYDKERLLIELFRNKKNIPYDYYKSVVLSYRKLSESNQIDLVKLNKYLKSFNNGATIANQIRETIL